MVSAAGLIDRDGRLLMCTRPAPKDWAGMWEFPGGKVEAGERPADALVRELKEELGVETVDTCLAPFSFSLDPNQSLILLLFLCRKWSGTPTPQEGQKIKWVLPKDVLDLDMPPLDRPLAAQVRDYLLP
ncbi:NTP pyrophosphohydrolase [Parvularcula bermudensis HTCC2503]|uniref:8-oxo-dGTP diphosphatase n=1 Tax=Parvularcula bermudensis (strain ATCC BAA-594 / HTCC2503 / KCTC 12087) TaxID=314260 RepID=E0TG50_PARBH|nr:(deoxy)nucleoside triphosphate pyrophosphohydrolase [Parvularcula bermudensis]ADM10621.1 NTP pyrophosphohydrolase [Parvularcula bermudensis HTCC2503]